MSKTAKTVLVTIAIIIVLGSAAWLYRSTQGQETAAGFAAPSVNEGVTMFKAKKYAEALEVFESIPPGGPQEWYTRYYQGSTQIMLKDYQAAVETLEQALALNNTETRIMHALGVAYFKLGNLKLSKAYFAAVLEIEPDNDEARGLMDIMAKLERNQETGATQEPESTVENGK
jgi:tetratricopeptide (TPR) repeat protein